MNPFTAIWDVSLRVHNSQVGQKTLNKIQKTKTKTKNKYKKTTTMIESTPLEYTKDYEYVYFKFTKSTI